MRFGLVIAVIVCGVVFMTNGFRILNYGTPNIKQQTRSRAIRGYQPEKISTAIGVGFGKRDGSFKIPDLNRREKVLVSLLHNFPQGQSSEWILQEMKANPVFAGKLREMIIDDEMARRS